MRSPLANTRQAQYILLRARAYLQQVVHQTTHSLARFFLEIDANYKQFKTASRLRAAAAQRLDAQRAYYEEGRITIDRFLDAVSQYATAVATEAQYKTTYNISIVALEEAKGTLLAYDNIAVAEGPHPRKAYIQARDIQDAHRQFHIPPDGPQVPRKPVGPLNPDPIDAQSAAGRRRPGGQPPLPGPVGPAGTAPRRRCRRTSRPRSLPILSQTRPGAGHGPAGRRRRRAASARRREPDRRAPCGATDLAVDGVALIDPTVPGMGPTVGRGIARSARDRRDPAAGAGSHRTPASAPAPPRPRPAAAGTGRQAPPRRQLAAVPTTCRPCRVSIDLPPLPPGLTPAGRVRRTAT